MSSQETSFVPALVTLLLSLAIRDAVLRGAFRLVICNTGFLGCLGLLPRAMMGFSYQEMVRTYSGMCPSSETNLRSVDGPVLGRKRALRVRGTGFEFWLCL